MTTGLLGMMAAQRTASKKAEDLVTGGAPKCDTCGTRMKPSQDGEKKIWICPLDPTHPTKPRE